MSNKHRKKDSTSLVIKEMRIKMTLRFTFSQKGCHQNHTQLLARHIVSTYETVVMKLPCMTNTY
jgi:hypothetical protein